MRGPPRLRTVPPREVASPVDRAARLLLREHGYEAERIVRVSSEETPGVVLWLDLKGEPRTSFIYLSDGKVSDLRTREGFAIE